MIGRTIKRWMIALGLLVSLNAPVGGGDWPRWRGPDGNGISHETGLPVTWSTTQNVRWRVELPGEGASSPVVVGDRIFLTCAFDDGERRAVLCLDRRDGKELWSREIADDNPEVTSALTGHAAHTPAVADGRVVAMFGNAGVVCYDVDGRRQWHRDLGDFETELGLASSPVIQDGLVFVVCDHDGKWYKTFDSFLIALDLKTGETRWKTDRRGLLRSWSTPIVVAAPDGQRELVVSAQDELRGYDPGSGNLLWQVQGTAGWVTPSPVFADGVIYASSGKDGPTIAVRPGGRGDVTETHVVWRQDRGGPYVCSPLLYQGRLYVPDEHGFLRCIDARTGEVLYRQRLGGKFTASPVAAEGRVFATNETGTTLVLQDGAGFQLLARNEFDEECLASAAISHGALFFRSGQHLYCIASQDDRAAP
jgi:outer membrane protein assembly factor BamB